MKKNIIFAAGFFLILAIAWGYFVWQGGAELRELNKDLPEGIRVVERNGGQVIVNEKDGYEIAVPEKWGGLENIEYLGEEEGEFLIGAKNTDDWVTIIIFEKNKNIDLEICLEKRFQDQFMRFYSPVILGKKKIGNYEVISVKDEDPIVGDHFFYYLYKKDSKVFEIYTDYSEESVRDIILNISF